MIRCPRCFYTYSMEEEKVAGSRVLQCPMCDYTISVSGSRKGFMLREAARKDLEAILELYLHLHEAAVPEESNHLRSTWDSIINDSNHHLIVCEIDGKLVSSCVCVIIPNLTRNARPYAFVENVVTHEDYRGKGYASACLEYAKKIAADNNCYKMMLLTGSKEEKTLAFYRNAGYNSADKTAFVQWLNMEENFL